MKEEIKQENNIKTHKGKITKIGGTRYIGGRKNKFHGYFVFVNPKSTILQQLQQAEQRGYNRGRLEGYKLGVERGTKTTIKNFGKKWEV